MNELKLPRPEESIAIMKAEILAKSDNKKLELVNIDEGSLL